MARSSLAALPLLWVLVGAAMTASAVYQDNYFFLQQDLYPGSTMTLHLAAAATGTGAAATATAALPRARVDDTIPFTSAKIPEILSRLSVPAGSPTAAAIRSTLAECEAPPLAGVAAQRCATSLESMADFAAACLGTRDVRSATMTRLSRHGGAALPPRQQPYVVESVKPHPVAGGDLVACHRMPYPYAVFSCHTTTAALYAVTLAGAEDGTKAEAMTACHKDASPGIFGPIYKQLGVAPGTVPVCHFLPQDSMLWMRK